MSKRKSQTAVDDYIEQGFIREAFVNYLALLGWATGTEEEVLSLDEIVERFELSAVHKGGAVFDRERLEWLNGQWIRRLDPDDLIDRLRPFVSRELDAGRIDRMPTDEELRSLLPMIVERLPRLGVIGDLVGFLWVDDLQVDPAVLVPKRWDAATTHEALLAARDVVAETSSVTFEADELEPPLRALAEARGWKAGDLFMSIRVAVTGRTATPPLFDTLVALGRDRTLQRLSRPSPSSKRGACAMTHNDVQVWLDRYVAAWMSYDPRAIGDLFAEMPIPIPSVGRRVKGRAAIVEELALRRKDEPRIVGGPLRRLGVRRRAGVGHRREPLPQPRRVVSDAVLQQLDAPVRRPRPLRRVRRVLHGVAGTAGRCSARLARRGPRPPRRCLPSANGPLTRLRY